MTQITKKYRDSTSQEIEIILNQLIAEGHVLNFVWPTRDYTWRCYDETLHENLYTNDWLVVYTPAQE